MNVSSVAVNSSMQYEPKAKSNVKEKEKESGVISKVSFDFLPQETQDKIKSQIQGKSNLAPANHRLIYGNSVHADGTVSFYGASMTKEQSEKLQSVIKNLEEQGNGNLGDGWNTAAYAQLGLKVSQLSYACREAGLSDEASAQVTGTYGKQMEEKINKTNDMFDSIKEVLDKTRKDLMQRIKEKSPEAYEKYTALAQSRGTGHKETLEVSKQANRDVYQMFSKLDASSKDAFKASFEQAIKSFRNYFASGEAQVFTGTDSEQVQVDKLRMQFNDFM